jgi:hypothetical protein
MSTPDKTSHVGFGVRMLLLRVLRRHEAIVDTGRPRGFAFRGIPVCVEGFVVVVIT